jgi:hypothetical protein
MQDLTERKEAETRLRESEERLRTSEARLLDTQRLAKVGSWEREIESGKMHWSDEMRRILGGLNEFPQNLRAFLSYVHPKDREKILEAYSRMRSGRAPFETEYRIIPPDGGVRFVRSIVQMTKDARGAPTHILGGDSGRHRAG